MSANFTTILAALLTPTVAILGALIAYRQWKLAQNKLKLDLFDRRFKVYEAAARFLSTIVTEGRVNDDEFGKYTSGTREAKWLLSAEVEKYLDQVIRHKALHLQLLDAELDNVDVSELRTKNVAEQAEMLKWFARQFEVLDQYFAPFLQLQH